MKLLHRIGLAGLLAATAMTPAAAQSLFSGPTGYQAGDVMVHLSVIGVIPENIGSHTSLPNYHVETSAGISPELDLSYFFTPTLSLQAIAATTKHDVWIQNGGSKVKVGSTWVLPPTVTLQYHFPQMGMIRPYAGLGLTVAFFYSPSAAAGIDKMGGLSTGIGPALDVGFDVPFHGNWSANFDVKQIFLVTGTHVNGSIGALTELDPTVVGAGIGYKF